MNDSPTIMKAASSHVILKGSAYEAGAFQAGMIETMPGFVQFFRSGRDVPLRQKIEQTLLLFQEFCPGVDEEIAGFCDCLQIPPEHLIYYAATHLSSSHCSHLAALPAITSEQHVLVGRNYDFSPSMDDLRLCSTFIEGKYAHIGFSTMFFGRNDGMNEHGLSATASVGGMPVGLNPGMRTPVQNGLQFWALLRAILERCRTVDEGIALFHEFPICGNPILIIADPSGRAARLEGYGPQKSVCRIDNSSADQYLIATNHFLSPGLRRVEPAAQKHSTVRYQSAEKLIQEQTPRISIEVLKRLLSGRYPQGLCCHYYPEFFGTLHSIVFDLTDRRAEITFGSPAANTWHSISFSDELPCLYETLLPQEQACTDFWQPDHPKILMEKA